MNFESFLEHIHESVMRTAQDPTQSIIGMVLWLCVAFALRGIKAALPQAQLSALAAHIMSSLEQNVATVDDKIKVVNGGSVSCVNNGRAVVCYGGKSFRKSIQFNGEDASPYLKRRERRLIYNKVKSIVRARDNSLAFVRAQEANMKELDRRRRLGIA